MTLNAKNSAVSLLIGLTLMLLSFSAGAECFIPNLPSKFELKERIISFTTSFVVSNQGQKLGTVNAKFFSFSDTFSYKDEAGNKIADARTRLFSWGTHIDVTDCEGKKIGEIKENVFRSLFKVYTVYTILDGNGTFVAESEKKEWITTEFNLFDSHGTHLAKINRPWLNILSDKWTVEMYRPEAIDPRLIIMIGAFKTHVDNKRRLAEDNFSNR